VNTIIGLSAVCVAMTIVIILLSWYIRNILSKLLYVSETIADFLIVVENFENHLNAVNNMDMYYGDETLQHLLDHSKAVLEEVERFSSIYSLSEDPEPELTEEELEELEYEEEEQINDDEEASAPTPSPKGKTLFHSGT